MNGFLLIKPCLGSYSLNFNEIQHALLFNLEGKYFGYSSMKLERTITSTDKSGSPFEIKMGYPEDFSFVLEMYRTFSPKPASQGLPPEDPETCQDWLKELFEIGENVLAWRGDSVIGHAALVPDTKGRSCEFVIFVDQDARNLGIGAELTRFALEESRQLCSYSVWLTVNVSNFIAIKLYRKCGFEYCDIESYERTMRFRLREL